MESVNQSSFYAHGKLLLTAEYAVLDGAKALCLPTKKGQSMLIKTHAEDYLEWNAFLPGQELWFTCRFDKELKVIHSTHKELSSTLLKIFKAVKDLKPSFSFQSLKISTYLEFNKNWGLGSSSTLISLIAQWTKINPYQLLEKTFGGSGYDIACATASQPLFYENKNAVAVNFNPPFINSIFFIYLNQKQNSREAIQQYKSKPKSLSLINAISNLTDLIAASKNLNDFEYYIHQHENLISNHLEVPRIQNKLFKSYKQGVVKSLGGWGGDFILATGTVSSIHYFKEKGFTTIFPYSELIL